jgi:hypothetical protein
MKLRAARLNVWSTEGDLRRLVLGAIGSHRSGSVRADSMCQAVAPNALVPRRCSG